MTMKREEWKSFFDSQIESLDLAKLNVTALDSIITKPFKSEDLHGLIQFNPSRAISSLAKLDAATISIRKCFLCEDNRPHQQKSYEILPGWDLLVNPYPILKYHFTISCRKHVPQSLDINTGCELAKQLEGLVVFFHADGAGASAPDHLHYQAVPIESLPLIKLLDEDRTNETALELPFRIMRKKDELEASNSPLNVYFWVNQNKQIKILAIPRKNHRPNEYFLNPPERIAVSPGAIDMAGVIVVPIEEDYHKINDEIMAGIYNQVSFRG